MNYETRWGNVLYLSGRYPLLMGHLLKTRWGSVLYLSTTHPSCRKISSANGPLSPTAWLITWHHPIGRCSTQGKEPNISYLDKNWDLEHQGSPYLLVSRGQELPDLSTGSLLQQDHFIWTATTTLTSKMSGCVLTLSVIFICTTPSISYIFFLCYIMFLTWNPSLILLSNQYRQNENMVRTLLTFSR